MAKRILLVESDPGVLEVMNIMLRYIGCDVVATDSGIKALNAFVGDPFSFDLVISDVQTQGLSGLELAGRILEKRPEVPMAILSGGDQLIESEVHKQGIRCLIKRPIRIGQLASIVSEVLLI